VSLIVVAYKNFRYSLFKFLCRSRSPQQNLRRMPDVEFMRVALHSHTFSSLGCKFSRRRGDVSKPIRMRSWTPCTWRDFWLRL